MKPSACHILLHGEYAIQYMELHRFIDFEQCTALAVVAITLNITRVSRQKCPRAPEECYPQTGPRDSNGSGQNSGLDLSQWRRRSFLRMFSSFVVGRASSTESGGCVPPAVEAPSNSMLSESSAREV